MAGNWYQGQPIDGSLIPGSNDLTHWYQGAALADATEGNQELTGTTIATAESFGVGVVVGDQLLDGGSSTIATGESVPSTGVVAGPITGASPIASGESFPAGALDATFQLVGGVLSIPSAEEFPLGVVAGPVTGVSPIATAESFPAGLLNYDQELSGSTIATAEDFDIGSVAQQLSGNTIASAESFGLGALAFAVAGYDTIPSGEQFLPGGTIFRERNLALYVRGIDRSSWLKVSTWEMTSELDGRASASFTIETAGHPSRLQFRPSPYDEVVFMFNNRRRFGGFVQDYEEAALEGTHELRIHVILTDYRQLTEDRYFAAVYSGPTFSLRSIMRDVKVILDQENIRWSESDCEDLIVTGVSASKMRFNDVPISEALARISSYFGCIWRITLDRELIISRARWRSAPRTIRNDGTWRNMVVKRSSRLNRTRQGVRTGLPVAGQRETTLVGNGTHNYALAYQLTEKPLIVVDDVEQTVILWSDRTLYPYDFAYEVGSNILIHNPAQAVYDSSNEIVITHPSGLLDVLWVDDTAAQSRLAARTGGSGIVEVVRLAREIRDRSTAINLANAELEHNGASAESLTWEEDEYISTHQHFAGVRVWEPGQIVQVFCHSPLVAGMFVVQSVKCTEVGATFLRYTVTAASRELPMITAVEVDPDAGTITITVDRPIELEPGSGINLWGAGGLEPIWGNATPLGSGGGIDGSSGNTVTFRLPPEVDPGDVSYLGGIGGVQLPSETGPVDGQPLLPGGIDGPTGGYIFSGIPPTGGPGEGGTGIGVSALTIIDVNTGTNEVTVDRDHGWTSSDLASATPFRVTIFGVTGCDAPNGSSINNPFTRITVTGTNKFTCYDVGDISGASGFERDGHGHAVESDAVISVTPGTSTGGGLRQFFANGTYLENNDQDTATFILASAIPGVAGRPLATGTNMTNAWEAERESSVVESVVGRFETPPLGDNIIIDIKKNGNTIFRASNPLTIPDGSDSSIRVSTFNENPLMVERGDKLTIDVNQVGSDFPGCGGTVHVNMRG